MHSLKLRSERRRVGASERMQGCAADPVYVKGEVFAYVGLPQNLKDLQERDPFGLTQTLQQSHPLSPQHEPLHWRAKRDPKAKMLYLQSFVQKGVSLGYVGLN